MEELAGRRWQTATLLKLLSRLEERGFVKREKEGRNNLYTPLVRREDYLSAESRAFLQRLHGGSLPSLVAALMDSRAISRRDLEELEEILERGTAVREFLSGLFEVSLTMGAVTALLLVLSPVWKRRFRPQWRCWAWLLVALRLAVPFNVSLPRAPVVLEAPPRRRCRRPGWRRRDSRGGADRPDAPAGRGRPGGRRAGVSLTTAELAFAAWAAVAAGVLAARLLRYAAFRRRTARWCTTAGTYEGVPVYACALLSSPALTGLLRPRILLPEGWRRSGGPLPWPMRPCTPAAGICGARPCCCGCAPSTGSTPGLAAPPGGGAGYGDRLRRRRAGRPGRGVAAEVRRGPALLCARGAARP